MGEGAFAAYLGVWSALAALKWMLPLMVKSIGDGDIVARLETVTIAILNSAPPFPPKI